MIGYLLANNKSFATNIYTNSKCIKSTYPTDLSIEEAIYDEFINEKHWSDNDFLSTSICGILVLGALYFMVLGLGK